VPCKAFAGDKWASSAPRPRRLALRGSIAARIGLHCLSGSDGNLARLFLSARIGNALRLEALSLGGVLSRKLKSSPSRLLQADTA